jgi:hypothetical protein
MEPRTILVTVLTNSFMAVVQNANEEHQFLFAVNTISMVKSDALFSYIPPTNIIGWLLIPFKYCMPFKRFVRLNRLIIKITHIPILFTIFLYERLLLSNLSYGPTDLVEHRGRSASKAPAPAFSVRGAMDVPQSPHFEKTVRWTRYSGGPSVIPAFRHRRTKWGVETPAMWSRIG